jgi:hypothetical protein
MKDLAERADRRDQRNRLRQLKLRIYKTAHSCFVKGIEDRENIKFMTSIGKITWKDILEQADMQDRQNKKLNILKECTGQDDVYPEKIEDGYIIS